MMAAVRRAITGFLLCGAFFLSTSAWAAADAGRLNPSEGWRLALGYTYLSEARDLKDSIKRLSREHGEGGDIYNLSLNLSFQPYYQFPSGWRAGAGIGPFLMFYGDSRHLQIPFHLTLGYSFLILPPWAWNVSIPVPPTSALKRPGTARKFLWTPDPAERIMKKFRPAP